MVYSKPQLLSTLNIIENYTKSSTAFFKRYIGEVHITQLHTIVNNSTPNYGIYDALDFGNISLVSQLNKTRTTEGNARKIFILVFDTNNKNNQALFEMEKVLKDNKQIVRRAKKDSYDFLDQLMDLLSDLAC